MLIIMLISRGCNHNWCPQGMLMFVHCLLYHWSALHRPEPTRNGIFHDTFLCKLSVANCQIILLQCRDSSRVLSKIDHIMQYHRSLARSLSYPSGLGQTMAGMCYTSSCWLVEGSSYSFEKHHPHSRTYRAAQWWKLNQSSFILSPVHEFMNKKWGDSIIQVRNDQSSDPCCHVAVQCSIMRTISLWCNHPRVLKFSQNSISFRCGQSAVY